MSNIIYPNYNYNIEKALSKIEKSLDENLYIEQLANISGYSPFHFQRLFKEYTGENIGSYIKRLRIEKGAFMLKYQYERISTVAIRTGFNSNTSFTRAFKRYYNISPLEFKGFYKDKFLCDDTPTYKIVEVEPFDVFFIRVFGNYKTSEPLAWKILSNNYTSLINNDPHYVSICYDEPTISKKYSKLRYEACLLYEEEKHQKFKNRLLRKTVEGGRYAKFEFEGNLNELDSFFYCIYETFYHLNDFQISLKPTFQVHHNNFNNLLYGRTKTDLFIPLD
ncbi:AraC family transcriptional regulator [Malaciobacter marinus]|uniref:AraC family transcriptional regulator n=1 Tax=Malaciobacter marinus TaxID=505249 RepID=UPI003B00091E